MKKTALLLLFSPALALAMPMSSLYNLTRQCSNYSKSHISRLGMARLQSIKSLNPLKAKRSEQGYTDCDYFEYRALDIIFGSLAGFTCLSSGIFSFVAECADRARYNDETRKTTASYLGESIERSFEKHIN